MKLSEFIERARNVSECEDPIICLQGWDGEAIPLKEWQVEGNSDAFLDEPHVTIA